MRVFVALVLAVSSVVAEGHTYRCTGKDGKKHYGQTIPVQCAGVLVELLNSQGMVVRSINPQFEAEQKALEARNAAEAQERAEKDRRQLDRIESEKLRPSQAPLTRDDPVEQNDPGLSGSEPLQTPEIPERPDRDRRDPPHTSPLRGTRR